MSYDAPPQPSPNPYGGGVYDSTPPAHQHYAHWGKRVASYLVDTVVLVVPYTVAAVCFVLSGEETSSQTVTNANGDVVGNGADVSFGGPMLVIAIVIFMAAIAFGIWNVIIRQGRTGRSIGKSALSTRLVKEHTGQPLGIGMTFVRQVCHVLDSILYLGYLWPLWDAKRQTFADKIVGTVVLDQSTTS